MTKYIKSKDGKFAGSIGAGKTAVPAIAPEGVVPASSVLAGPGEKYDAAVQLAELAEAYKTNLASATQETFGTHASLGESELANDPQLWADNLYNLTLVQTPAQFNEEFLQKTAHYNNGQDQKQWMIYDGENASATLIYSRDNDEAWIETYTRSGGVATSVPLENRYAKYCRDK